MEQENSKAAAIERTAAVLGHTTQGYDPIVYTSGKDDLAEALGISPERCQAIEQLIGAAFDLAQESESPIDVLMASCTSIPENCAEGYMVGYHVGFSLRQRQQEEPVQEQKPSLILPAHYRT